MEKRSRNRWLWIIGGGIVLLLVVFLIWRQMGLSRQNAAVVQSGDIVTAFIGDLESGATATGQVLARRDAALALERSGVVEAIFVEVGDTVRAGDALLQLETAALQRAVTAAEQAVVAQQANLDTLQSPPGAAEIAAAEATVASAQANLDLLLNGPDETQRVAAEADLRSANAEITTASARLDAAQGNASPEAIRAAELELQLAQEAATRAAEQHSTILVTEPNQFLSEERLAELEQSARAQAVQANADLAAAQEAYDDLINGDPNAVGAAQGNLSAAVARRDAAQARLDALLAGPTEADVATARATLAQAQANLDQLQRGPSSAQLAAAEVQLEQARFNLQRARQDLERATLYAPFDGIVTAVHVSEGETASGVVIDTVDTTSLEVVLRVDEVDIAMLEPGQPATITLEGRPDESLEGVVTAIAPRAVADDSTVATFEVYLSFAQPEGLPLLVGMTADAELQTSLSENILLVPNAAINVDRSVGTYSVNLVRTDASGNRNFEEVPVTIGLRDNNYTQILSGLEEGDQVFVGTLPTTPTFGPGGDFGPDGGGPGGGPFGG